MDIKYADIEKANKTLKAQDIKGKDYIEVNQRIKAFRMLYPMGCISTEIVSLEGGVVVMKATVADETGRVLGTGLAYEKESSSYINKTSYIENCETSAVGRALGMCGLGIDTSVASAEEVQNAQANQPKDYAKEKPTNELKAVKAKLAKLLKAKGINQIEYCKSYGLNSNSTVADFQRCIEELMLA